MPTVCSGRCCAARASFTEGVGHLYEAVRLNPKDGAGRFCLGKALAAQGKTDEAIDHLSSAVQLEPDDAAALHLLGQLLFRQGKAGEAIQHVSRAVEIKSDDPLMLGDLAWMLALAPDAALRDGSKAAGFARRACELTQYKSFAALDILGMSCAAAGRFSEAIQAAEQAAALARTAGQSEAAAGIMERIELYRRGRVYEQVMGR